MRILINGKTWYDLSDFDDYEEIEELGEITDTIGIPDCVDIESAWYAIQEYLKLADDEQAIMLAYAEATGTFDWEEAQEAFVGKYANGAEFAQSLCEEAGYIPKDLPAISTGKRYGMQNCIGIIPNRTAIISSLCSLFIQAINTLMVSVSRFITN